MSKYTFTFKKDNIFVEFTTADRDVVERQFQIWVADADEYARMHKSKPTSEKASKAEPKEPKETKVPEAEKSVEQAKIEPQQEQPIKEAIEKITEIEESSSQLTAHGSPIEEEPVFDKASSLLKTINTIQNEVSTEEIKVEETTQPEGKVDFEAVLEKTIDNPTFEPEKSKDPIFLNLVNSKNTKDKFHYLIMAAFYLSEFEKMERFSLKQINAKLMQNVSAAIDHAMLQDAINQNLIELIPDLTGVSEVAEYRLTRAGEEFFANKI